MTGMVSSAVCLVLPLLSVFYCSGVKTIKSAECGGSASLTLGVHSEFVELSFQDVFNLYLRNNDTGETRLITGENAVLPGVKRYRDMVRVRDFNPGEAKSLFNYHYIDPELFTDTEFDLICDCYEKNGGRFSEVSNKIGAFVYGNHDMFREIFKLPDGFFLMTEFDGKITIVTDPSVEARTLVPEKRHFNNVGYFDDNNILHIRKGKIISGEITGFYGKPVKQVMFISEDNSVEYTGEVETLWSDILYSSEKTGVNVDYILSAVNGKGEKLGEVFRYKEFYSR